MTVIGAKNLTVTSNQIFQDMFEPTGFVERNDSTISFDNSTRFFTISPVSTSYEVYIGGQKITISSSLSIQIPNISGTYFFYIDANGSLQYMTTFDISLIKSLAYISNVYWNATAGYNVVFAEERHGIVMDGDTHRNLHTTRGCQYVSGADISYVIGNGSLNSHMNIGMTGSRIADEDIVIDIIDDPTPTAKFEQILSPVSYLPIWHRLGATEWYKTTATQFPLIQGTSRAKYNSFDGSVWSLVEAPSNNKVLVTYVFATTNLSEPVVGILGQTQYQNLVEARELAVWKNINFGFMPAQEMKLLYVVYYETSATYGNTPKSRIVGIDDLRLAQDRQTGIIAGSANSVFPGLNKYTAIIPAGTTVDIDSMLLTNFIAAEYTMAFLNGTNVRVNRMLIEKSDSQVTDQIYGRSGFNFDLTVQSIVSSPDFKLRVHNFESFDLEVRFTKNVI